MIKISCTRVIRRMLIVMSISTVISALIAVLPHVIIDPTPFVWSAPYRDHSQKLGWRAGSTWVQCRLFVYEWQSANRYHGDIGEASTPQFSATAQYRDCRYHSLNNSGHLLPWPPKLFIALYRHGQDTHWSMCV